VSRAGSSSEPVEDKNESGEQWLVTARAQIGATPLANPAMLK